MNTSVSQIIRLDKIAYYILVKPFIKGKPDFCYMRNQLVAEKFGVKWKEWKELQLRWKK